MKVAVVTAYHAEEEKVLRRCHESVRAQTHTCSHVMVADGRPSAMVDGFPAHHIRLPKAHADYGDTPRTIGAISAISQGFDAIAFLDADNWYRPEHVAAMVALHERTGAAVCTATRDLFRLDGSYMATCLTSDGQQHADTNTLFLTRAAFPLIPRWVTIEPDEHPIGDRIFWLAVKDSGLPRAHEARPTVCYLATHAGFYLAMKEPVPPGVSSGEEVRKALQRWQAKGGPSLNVQSRLRVPRRPAK
jgi:hypothetical protein